MLVKAIVAACLLATCTCSVANAGLRDPLATRCHAAYDAENYELAAKLCEASAKVYVLLAKHDKGQRADLDLLLAATQYMFAGPANWTDDANQRGYRQVRFAITLFDRIAIDGNSRTIRAEATIESRTAKTELAKMRRLDPRGY